MHPKSMYKMGKDGMQEVFAMSFDEQWKLEREGYHGHPEEARQSYHPVTSETKAPEKKSLADMDKAELEQYGRTLGVELDKRKSKTNMLKELEEMLI